ncbi:Xanthohumol 4-O-methyltransferase [Salvia divinorum]|uniref:Xanthohumol 4-O-methyltransferase n=1 Tax=Salvia divinorum TaxID=28513 RepID=A0ABD1I207_SALDI
MCDSIRHTRCHPQARKAYDAFPSSRRPRHPKTDSLRRLMRVLVHSNFFHKAKTEDVDVDEDEEVYSLTPASLLLLEDEPLSAVPLVRAMLDPILTDLWHNLSQWFRNDSDTAFLAHHGRSVWEYMAADEGLNVLLNKSLACDAGFVASVLINECKHVFHGLKVMVDVGGGTGATAKAVAAGIPGLKCVVLDLPHVVAGREGSENVTYLSGDMFDFIPEADAVFLKWILHDWNEECVRILKKCKEAISSNNHGGKVILVEVVMEDEKETYEETETKLFFDMQMLATTTGKERSEKEWAKIFSAAGFGNYKITRLLGLRSVIEVFP